MGTKTPSSYFIATDVERFCFFSFHFILFHNICNIDDMVELCKIQLAMRYGRL